MCLHRANVASNIARMQVDATEPLLNADDVTQILGVSKRTFESIVQRNEAPTFFLIGRQRRWRSRDVVSWINALADNAAQQRRNEDGLSLGKASTPI